jgi:ribosomal protein S18 acetylase RimI-like enzyme
MIPLEVVALAPFAHERVERALLARRRALPRRRRDGKGRAVEIGEWLPEDWDGLLAMYRAFDPAQRAQGLPPVGGEERLAAWVDKLLRRGPNVVARADERVVGHAALVQSDGGDGAATYELAVFVHPDYQGAGVGRALVEAALTLARRRGAERVWLSVERRNLRAIALYRRMGFRRVSVDKSEEEIWALPVVTRPAASRVTLPGGITMSFPSKIRVRVRGLVAALRFAWIPATCAVVIATASEEPRGRMLGLTIVLISLCLGLAVHAREIVLGRPLTKRASLEDVPTTAEWLAALR